MQVKIYQLPVEHERCFRGFNPGLKFPLGEYKLAWEGELIGRTLEKVYRELNYAHPAYYKARSLSVSDIVSATVDGKERLYFCDSVGWVRIEGAMPEAVLAKEEQI